MTLVGAVLRALWLTVRGLVLAVVWAAPYCYRWVTGRPVDGRPRTDATWLHPGTRALTASGRASRWAMLPGWKRQLWRHGATVAALTAWWSWEIAPLLTEAGAATAAAGTAAYGARRIRRATADRQHHRDWVTPLAETLAPVLYGSAKPPAGWLDVPHDVHEDGPVTVHLPGWTEPARQQLVIEIVRAKLGMATADSSASADFRGRNNTITVRRDPTPPAMVGLDDAVQHMLDAPESAPVIGIGRKGAVIAVDLDAESPHILVSAGSGGGKSVITRSIAAQMMRHGAQVTVLDVKRQSHRWAKGLPGVTYCRDTSDIHDQLLALAAEGERRNRLADDIPDDVDTTALDVGPRILVVCEEMNATINRLSAYWQEIKGKDEPKQSPAVKALNEILFMGRAVKMHVVAIAQMMTARALGGPEARENFATRILARYTVNAWKMLAPEVWPMPKSSRHKGRLQVVIGGAASMTQGLFLTDAQAREWATGGVVSVPVTWSADEVGRARRDAQDRARTGTRHTDCDTSPGLRDGVDVTVDVTAVPDPSGGPGTAVPELAVTLPEAARRGVVPLSYDALRKAKSRDESFPAPTDTETGKYDPRTLRDWYANRQENRYETRNAA